MNLEGKIDPSALFSMYMHSLSLLPSSVCVGESLSCLHRELIEPKTSLQWGHEVIQKDAPKTKHQGSKAHLFYHSHTT